MKNTALYSIFGAVVLLATMGLVFCWLCPYGDWFRHDDPHWMFKRMVAGNLTGLLLCGLSVAVGWRRWLKTAPLVCVAWIGLVAYAATLPTINGTWGWIPLGPLTFNVWEMCPLVIGLFSAWFSWKMKLKPFWALLLIAFAVAGFMGERIVTNADSMQRLKVLFGKATEMPPTDARAKSACYVANQSAGMISASKWFGITEFVPRILPRAATAAMPAGATALFGKWYLVLLCAAFGLLGAGFAMSWTSVAENSKRSFVLALGLAVVGPMVMNYLGCLLIVPMMMSGIAWASFGGSLAVMSWLATGVLAAMLLDKEEAPRELRTGEVWGIGSTALVWTILLSLAICRLQARKDIQLLGHQSEAAADVDSRTQEEK